MKRRGFLQGVATAFAAPQLSLFNPFPAALARSGRPSSPNTMPWPKSIGSPVLDSLHYAIESSRNVHTNYEKIIEVAGWMAYEDLPMPEFTLPLGVGHGDADEVIDFVMVADSIDTAFTDFTHHQQFQVDYAGQHWSDSEAEFACLK